MDPQARPQGLIATELPSGEVVVYDAAGSCYHHLNPVCAAIWDAWDSPSSPEQLAASLGPDFTPELVELALEELRAKKLLAPARSDQRAGKGVPRRAALHRMAVQGAAAMMLPVVTTLTMPKRGLAQSEQPMDSPETPPPTGICDGGVSLIILKYVGTAPLGGEVRGRRRSPQMSAILPAQNVGTPLAPRYQFAIVELGGLFDSVAQGRLANNFTIFVGATAAADFHTSCSSPIFPGMPVGGGFVITEVHSVNGGVIGVPSGETEKVKDSKGLKK